MTTFAYGVATIGVAVVLLAAGIGKLARTPDPEHMAALGLPPRLRSVAVIRAHACAEILLALALIALPGLFLAAAGLAALALSVTYLVVAWRAWRSPEALRCHCFGADDTRPVGPAHLALNLALVVASGVTIAGGIDGFFPARDLHPAIAGVLAIPALFAFFWPGEGERRPPDLDAHPYLRRPVPAGAVVIDGASRDLRELTKAGAHMLIRIPRLGRDREYVEAALPSWRERLPRVTVSVTSGDRGGAYRRLGMVGAPSAVVLGADGLLAAGPAMGYNGMSELVRELARTIDSQAEGSSDRTL
ncbi:hypothetical protein CZ771_11425 [Actinomycetales bacterium JB111]|nr:hypothetical protein CZ771_11425 [Actinomycetales bacterium JB111]